MTALPQLALTHPHLALTSYQSDWSDRSDRLDYHAGMLQHMRAGAGAL
jgi:hypothetical protein